MLVLLCFACNSFSQSLSGEQVIRKSIAFHDPENSWSDIHLILDLSETRPNGPNRSSLVEIDNPNGYFRLVRNIDGNAIGYEVTGDDCVPTLNYSDKFSEEDVETFGLTSDRGITMRNYYTYLWGLPMKLRDAGTIVHKEVEKVKFHNRACLKVRVTYNEDVGSDTWYFYVDDQTFALVAYQFYHDESANDGEYIILEGMTKLGALTLPSKRSWYVNTDDRYLGTDVLDNAMVKTK